MSRSQLAAIIIVALIGLGYLCARYAWPRMPRQVRPYSERAPMAAFFLGISSGFPYAMIGATLTTRLAQDGIDQDDVTTFTLAFLVYNLKLALGVDRRRRAHPRARPARPARLLADRRRRCW